MLGQPRLDADPAGGRLQAHRQAARGRHRDRPRADRHRRCCARRASSASSSSSSAPASPRCRSPTARRSPTWRRSTARRCGIFPVDEETLRYLRFTGRSAEQQVALVEAYAKEQGLFRTNRTRRSRSTPTRSSSTSATVEPSLAGPKRPQDRVPLSELEARPIGEVTLPRRSRAERASTQDERRQRPGPRQPAASPAAARACERQLARRGRDRGDHELHQHVEPGGADRRRPARQEGASSAASRRSRGSRRASRRARRWSPTTCTKAGLMPYLEALGFHLVGYGCTTCIGNSGPLPDADRRRGEGRRPGRRVGAVAATATSRAASTRGARELSSRRRRWSSPTRWPARWTST